MVISERLPQLFLVSVILDLEDSEEWLDTLALLIVALCEGQGLELKWWEGFQ